MDDVRDAFAALFCRIRGLCYDDLSEEERHPFRVYADAAMGVVKDHREILYYAFGLPTDSTPNDVMQLLRRHHIAIGKALDVGGAAYTTTTFPCPDCGATLTVTRKIGNANSPITALCQCGRSVYLA